MSDRLCVSVLMDSSRVILKGYTVVIKNSFYRNILDTCEKRRFNHKISGIWQSLWGNLSQYDPAVF